MLVVLDTNVIISALLATGGKPAQLIDRWEAGEFDVAVSRALLDELAGALSYPKIARRLGYSDEEIRTFLEAYLSAAAYVFPETGISGIDDDPDDNRVLECAIAARAPVIVTGDRHLLALQTYQEIEIFTPTEFTAFLDSITKS